MSDLTEYKREYYQRNKEKIKSRSKARADRVKADPTLLEISRKYHREHAKRVRAEWRASHPKEPRVRCPEKLNAAMQKRDAYSLARGRARYADPTTREETKQRQSISRRKNPKMFLLTAARARARAKGLEFTIDSDTLNIPENCPICGVRMHVADGMWAGNSHSIDRIDPTRGYVPDNTAIICFNCNAVKSNGTADLHERIADYMRKGGAS